MPAPRLTASMLFAVLVITSCTSARANRTDTGEVAGPLVGKPTLTIAVKIDQPGTGYIENGDPDHRTGLDVDVARYIAAHLGPRPKSIIFVDVTSGTREALITGDNAAKTKVDLVIATYTIDDARAAVISFAGPYLIAGQTVLVRKPDAAKLDDSDGRHLEASLRNLTVCTVFDSTPKDRLTLDLGAAWARQHLVLQSGYQDCVSRLMARTVDAVSTDNAVLAGYLQLPQYAGQLYLARHVFSTEPYGIGLAKSDTADRTAINAVLRKMIAGGDWARFVHRDLGPAAGPFLAAPPVPGP